MSPRFVEKPTAEQVGLRDDADLPWPLPYGLQPRDALRMVEDLYEMLYEVNLRLHEMRYDRLEELLDPAGYSGLISRSVVDRFHRFSRALVKNQHHNGYPDLLPHGAYPGDATPHGDRGGLEVKASRYESGWQSHGPRSGWFCVVQFKLDQDESKALIDREPTGVRAVLIAELNADDWSWQPAAPGRIRSGTASIRASGEAKLRRGAVWVDPVYEAGHQRRLRAALVGTFRSNAREIVQDSLRSQSDPVTARHLAERLAPPAHVEPEAIESSVRSMLKRLVRERAAERVGRGLYKLR
jgi:hypothetical protein